MKSFYLPVLALVSTVLGTKLHPSIASKKCLDVQGDILQDGTPVQIFDCNGTPAQQWQLGSSKTEIRLTNTNFCLDAGDSPGSGTVMKIWTCFSGLAAQTWSFNANGRITLVNQGLCLDMTDGDTSNGNNVQVWECTSGDKNQIWTT